MITIHGKTTYRDLDAVAQVCQGEPALQLATQLPSYSFGLQAAILQLMITWARSCHSTVLNTYIQNDSHISESVEKFVETIHGLVAVLLARRIETANHLDITERAKRIAWIRYSEFNRVEVKGGRFSLLVADGHPYASKVAPFVGLAEKLPEHRARRKDTFISDIRFHLIQCFRAADATPLKSGDLDRVIEVIYELFANTEEWGRSDISLAPLSNTVRGVLGQIIPIKLSIDRANDGSTATNAPLARYIRSVYENESLKAMHLLQVSVFDSGIGLAQRHLSKKIDGNFPIKAEYEAVRDCLRKRSTTSQDVTRGMGLFEVMRLLTRLDGFLRLRCGRLALFRDFIEDQFLYTDNWTPQTESFSKGFEYLWDWDVDPVKEKLASASSLTLNVRPPVNGTLITFWLPLKNTQIQLGLPLSS
jgi:hypothetical protein